MQGIKEGRKGRKEGRKEKKAGRNGKEVGEGKKVKKIKNGDLFEISTIIIYTGNALANSLFLAFLHLPHEYHYHKPTTFSPLP